MFDPASSAFQALEFDWQAASDAVSMAEAGLVAALKHFRRTGDDSYLKGALLQRLAAGTQIQKLMQKVWGDPI